MGSNEENKSKHQWLEALRRRALDGPWPRASHSAVEEQLRPGIPKQAFAPQVRVCFKIKLVGCVWIVWIEDDQAVLNLLFEVLHTTLDTQTTVMYHSK
jgi:hypothetical protein